VSTPAVWPGHHRPLGACWDGAATNFAVWSLEATGVDLCLFDEAGAETRLPLTERTLGVWHGLVPGVGPGQHYGFRVTGPSVPAAGRLFDPTKLLVDPYARAVNADLRSVVVGDGFDWGGDERPHVPWHDTVIYELHVKGFTARHPDVPSELRGTYAGLAQPAVLSYLRDLGVTTVELMPVHHFVSEPEVLRRGLSNYWGYNSIGFFAPHAAYSSAGGDGQQVEEFQAMVKAFHAAGLEVVIDVVYNHTGEGGVGGPTLSFRGLGDYAYYRRDSAGRYADVTGCGNTVDLTSPAALQLVMDSLRYWVEVMRVDGFRFDLASALARRGPDVDLRGPFLAAVGQDPVLAQVKLIAEPWDATREGYQLGSFPGPWCEWNDRFRDTVRDFWRGRGGVRDLGYRLSGSSDLYADDGRSPYASVNIVTCHDGFTLRDLVSYEQKHNQANGQDNQDGTDDNRSWNCGVEGESADPQVDALRHRQAANLLATLLLSTGVPMLQAGDERGRTQRGNNNAYCQDNEISWVDWSDKGAWSQLDRFARQLLRLRRQHLVLRQRHFFEGRPAVPGGRKDLAWFHPAGREMNETDWFDTSLSTIGMFLAGDAIRARGERGQRTFGDSLLVWLHAGGQPVQLSMPAAHWAAGYELLLSTATGAVAASRHTLAAGESLVLEERCVLVLKASD
jgi:isoamylase